MISLPRSTPFALVALALACSGRAKPPKSPPAPIAAPASTTPVAAPRPAAAAAAPVVEVSPLHVVALREGPIQLSRLHATPAVVLDGEPLPFVDGVPSRGPSGGRGLPTFTGYDSRASAIAIAGTLDASGTAWVSTEQEYDRAGSLYRVHRNRNQGKGWEPVNLRDGLLLAYHLAYVERDGVLLGLRAWDRDPEQDHWEPEDGGPKARAYRRALDRALADTRSGFVRLDGPKLAVPELPVGARPSAASTTNDGSLYVLAQVTRDDTATDVILVWPHGTTKAELVDLPDWNGYDPRLSTNGDVAIVTGATTDPKGGPEQSYLAMGLGTQWERVPVSLPGRPSSAPARVVGAARTPGGDLWIAVGDPWQVAPSNAPVWRRPMGTRDWEPVPLPAFGDDLFGRGEGFVYDVTGIEAEGWSAIERPTLVGLTPQATALAWLDDAVWVVLELGSAYELGADAATPRAVLLSTGPDHAAPPVRLPARGELYMERQDALGHGATPGKERCRRASLVLGPASLLQTRPELAHAVGEALATAAFATELIYVGRLDDQEMLVASIYVQSPAEARALQRAVAKATGSTPVVECRVPRLVKVVRSP